ncbi:MAG: LPS export ABC transporter periplasmic protein LptC [SAR324 cluster bacterium]|nr:LPS export ABC transporter periplasmic protein LptC [SAR324 cluster bacterium]
MIFRPLVFIPLLLLSFGALFVLMQPEEDKDSDKITPQETPLFLQQVELYEFKENQESLRLFAQQAQVFEKDELTLLFKVMANLQAEEEGGEPTKFRSNEARITGKNKFMTLQGKVEVELKKDSLLQTETLYYDQNSNRLFNHHFTTLVGLHEHVEASSLNFDTKKGILTLLKPIITVLEQ